MTERSVTYTTFTIERSYPVVPARVFAALSDPEAKARWADSPDVEPAPGATEFDFRVGGRERFACREPGGPTYRYDALYYDIVPDQRIVYCYEMYEADARISVSVATIELAKDAVGTKLTYTEQGAFLDGLAQAEDRKQGTEEQFDGLTEELRARPAAVRGPL
jgi:uncharacterized protein YndB with AHSA1/START domain